MYTDTHLLQKFTHHNAAQWWFKMVRLQVIFVSFLLFLNNIGDFFSYQEKIYILRILIFESRWFLLKASKQTKTHFVFLPDKFPLNLSNLSSTKIGSLGLNFSGVPQEPYIKMTITMATGQFSLSCYLQTGDLKLSVPQPTFNGFILKTSGSTLCWGKEARHKWDVWYKHGSIKQSLRTGQSKQWQ